MLKKEKEALINLSEEENLKIFFNILINKYLDKDNAIKKDFFINFYDDQNKNFLEIVLSSQEIEEDFKNSIFLMCLIILSEEYKDKYEEFIELIKEVKTFDLNKDESSLFESSILIKITNIFSSTLFNEILNDKGILFNIKNNLKKKNKQDFFKKVGFYSIDMGLENILKFILKLSIKQELGKGNLTLLNYCIEKNDRLLKVFFENNFDIKSTKEDTLANITSPLALAVNNRNRESVLEMLKNNFDPNSTDEKANKAITISASKGYVEITELLIAYNSKRLTGREVAFRRFKKEAKKAGITVFQMGVEVASRKGAGLPAAPQLGSIIPTGKKHTFSHTDAYYRVNQIFKRGNWIFHIRDDENVLKEENRKIIDLVSKLYKSITGEKTNFLKKASRKLSDKLNNNIAKERSLISIIKELMEIREKDLESSKNELVKIRREIILDYKGIKQSVENLKDENKEYISKLNKEKNKRNEKIDIELEKYPDSLFKSSENESKKNEDEEKIEEDRNKKNKAQNFFNKAVDKVVDKVLPSRNKNENIEEKSLIVSTEDNKRNLNKNLIADIKNIVSRKNDLSDKIDKFYMEYRKHRMEK